MTRVGAPVTSTSSPKFGTAKGDLSGAGNYLTTPDSTDLRFGTGNFTIELWHKMQSSLPGGTHSFFCSKGAAAALNNAWYFCILAGGNLTFTTANNNACIYTPYAHVADTTNWHHISLNRVGNVLTLYVDGSSVASATIDGSSIVDLYEGTGPLYVGGWNYGTANTRADFMDEFVIVKGQALRTANFTPPAAPFA